MSAAAAVAFRHQVRDADAAPLLAATRRRRGTLVQHVGPRRERARDRRSLQAGRAPNHRSRHVRSACAVPRTAPDPIASAAGGGMFARGRAPGSATAGGAACPSSRTSCSSRSTRCARITSAPTATQRARTPAIDRVARDGIRFDRALRHGADHADLAREPDDRPLSARPRRAPQRHAPRSRRCRRSPKRSRRGGFKTAAFVAAFPLDRRFGLIKGFQDLRRPMPRDADGHLANERPGRVVVDEALAWLVAHRAGSPLPLGAPLRAARAVRQSRRPGTVHASGDRAL